MTRRPRHRGAVPKAQIESEAIRLLTPLGVPSSARAVLQAITAEAFPRELGQWVTRLKHAALARLAGVSVPTVARAIRVLARAGFVRYDAGIGQAESVFTLTLPAVAIRPLPTDVRTLRLVTGDDSESSHATTQSHHTRRVSTVAIKEEASEASAASVGGGGDERHDQLRSGRPQTPEPFDPSRLNGAAAVKYELLRPWLASARSRGLSSKQARRIVEAEAVRVELVEYAIERATAEPDRWPFAVITEHIWQPDLQQFREFEERRRNKAAKLRIAAAAKLAQKQQDEQDRRDAAERRAAEDARIDSAFDAMTQAEIDELLRSALSGVFCAVAERARRLDDRGAAKFPVVRERVLELLEEREAAA